MRNITLLVMAVLLMAGCHGGSGKNRAMLTDDIVYDFGNEALDTILPAEAEILSAPADTAAAEVPEPVSPEEAYASIAMFVKTYGEDGVYVLEKKGLLSGADAGTFYGYLIAAMMKDSLSVIVSRDEGLETMEKIGVAVDSASAPLLRGILESLEREKVIEQDNDAQQAVEAMLL